MNELHRRAQRPRGFDAWTGLGVLGAVLLLGLLFVHVPASLWAGNTTEFHWRFPTFLVPGLAALVAGVAVCWLVLALLPARMRPAAASIVCAAGLTGWVYAFFLTGHLAVLNGLDAPMDFDTRLGAWELAVVAAAILVLAWIISRARGTALAAMLVLNVGLAATTVITVRSARHQRVRAPDVPVSLASLFRFSSRQNVLVLLFDGLQSDATAAVFAGDAHLAAAFQGFHFYRDTVGVAPTTFVSLPAIHSGREFAGDDTLAAYFEESVVSRSFMSRFARAGYETALVNPIQGLCPEGVRTCATPSQVLRTSGTQRTRESLRLLDVSLFRLAPIWLKRRIYRGGDWLFAGWFDASEEVGRIFEHNQLLTDVAGRLTVDDGPATLKVIHSLATHTPFVLNADCRTVAETSWEHMLPQARCALLAAAGLLDALRRAQVYDQTEIAVIADHGIGAPDVILAGAPARQAWSKRSGYANPTFLVKPRGARGPLVEDPAEVYLPDLGATLCASSGACEMPGVPAGEAPPGRVRRFLDYEWRDEFWARRDVEQLTAYDVSGPLRDPASWHEGEQRASAVQ